VHGLPAEEFAGAAGVADHAGHFIGPSRERAELRLGRVVEQPENGQRDIAHRDLLAAAHVHDFALDAGDHQRAGEGVDLVLDIGELAGLVAFGHLQ
jgi:hypothetical protein